MDRKEARNVIAHRIAAEFGLEIEPHADLDNTKNRKLKALVSAAEAVVCDLEAAGLVLDEG